MRSPALPVLLALAACGPTSVRVVMNAENNSGQAGYATITERGTAAAVEIVIGKSDDPRPQNAHVHPGRCGELGAIKAPLTPLQATGADPDHFRSTTDPVKATDGTPMTFQDLTAPGAYVLNVHDVRDASLYVSCGNID